MICSPSDPFASAAQSPKLEDPSGRGSCPETPSGSRRLALIYGSGVCGKLRKPTATGVEDARVEDSPSGRPSSRSRGRAFGGSGVIRASALARSHRLTISALRSTAVNCVLGEVEFGDRPPLREESAERATAEERGTEPLFHFTREPHHNLPMNRRLALCQAFMAGPATILAKVAQESSLMDTRTQNRVGNRLRAEQCVVT
jgi:hypothetical protein